MDTSTDPETRTTTSSKEEAVVSTPNYESEKPSAPKSKQDEPPKRTRCESNTQPTASGTMCGWCAKEIEANQYRDYCSYCYKYFHRIHYRAHLTRNDGTCPGDPDDSRHTADDDTNQEETLESQGSIKIQPVIPSHNQHARQMELQSTTRSLNAMMH